MQVATRSIQAMVTVAAVLLAESAALAQAIVPTNSAPNPYRAIENWAKLPEGSGVRQMPWTSIVTA